MKLNSSFSLTDALYAAGEELLELERLLAPTKPAAQPQRYTLEQIEAVALKIATNSNMSVRWMGVLFEEIRAELAKEDSND